MDKKFFELYNLILNEKPQKSDVIIWLQGDRYDRALIVLKLFKQKMSSKIILVGNDLLIGKGLRVGENNISLEKMMSWLIGRGIKKKYIKIVDGALDTPDQANRIINLAKKKKWKNVLLVGSSFYQPRAFLTFLKEKKMQNWCGQIINQPVLIDKKSVPGGRDKTAGELLADEYHKILKYKKNLAKPSEGIAYLKKNIINFTLRKAKISDAKFLFNWRNDPETRKNAFNQIKLKWQDHLVWFRRSLVNKNRVIYIFTNPKNIVGQVRFDIDDGVAEIDITIDKKFRGQGLGSKAVEFGSNYFLNKYRSVNKIFARIKEQNLASIFAHLKAGYKQIRHQDGVIKLEYARNHHQ